MQIRNEACAFKAEKLEDAARARQTAAFRLATGVDLDTALTACPADRLRLERRLRRLLERERLKGAARHWSYDLNRHIALAQAHTRLRETPGNDAP